MYWPKPSKFGNLRNFGFGLFFPLKNPFSIDPQIAQIVQCKQDPGGSGLWRSGHSRIRGNLVGHLPRRPKFGPFFEPVVPQIPALLDLIHPTLEGERHLKDRALTQRLKHM